MSIVGTSRPVLVCHCDRCGAESWPPAMSKSGALEIARSAGYVAYRNGHLCEGCARIEVAWDDTEGAGR